jgi:phytoene dehydrogenase-like protein
VTLPGFRHDLCAAVHALTAASPIFRSLPLADHGLELIEPPAALAHPFDDGTAAVLERSFEATGATLAGDEAAWRRLVEPYARALDDLLEDVLGPLRLPHHPLLLARFAVDGLRSAAGLARARLHSEHARALFAGNAGHAMLPLERSPSASFGLVLAALGHAVGWPFARGGSRALPDALASYLRSLGGEIETGRHVQSLDELPRARAVLLDLSPRALLRVLGDRVRPTYRRALERFRYGPGAFKIDWALTEPIPWRAAACTRAGTLHLGGTTSEISAAMEAAAQGRHSERPYVILAQQSLFDDTRAPAGRHTAWAYCHVPNGSTRDMTEALEAQVERFAPGFRDVVLARATLTAAQLEDYNPNYVGGDINAGLQTLDQLFTRPARRLNPYTTPLAGVYICSSSTPPGGGLHGMCGYNAARVALAGRLA